MRKPVHLLLALLVAVGMLAVGPAAQAYDHGGTYGSEGCTPGFWKNHPAVWASPPSPADELDVYFDFPSALADFRDDTMMQALGYPGGPGVSGATRILMRAAVAAYLNADHPYVESAIGKVAVVNAVNAALATQNRATILALAVPPREVGDTSFGVAA